MRKTGVLAGFVLVAALSGCAGILPFIPGEPRGDAVPVDALRCGDEFGLPDPDVVAGDVPADFEPVSLIRCEVGFELDGTGGPRAERFEGDLADLLTALAEPNEARSLGPCTADMWIGPELWLVDADGRHIRTPYPVTGCGKPRPEVLERIDAAIATLTPIRRPSQSSPR